MAWQPPAPPSTPSGPTVGTPPSVRPGSARRTSSRTWSFVDQTVASRSRRTNRAVPWGRPVRVPSSLRLRWRPPAFGCRTLRRMAHRITLIPGDGIGPEVSAAAQQVVQAAGVEVEWDVQAAGATVMEREGTPLPDRVLRSIEANRTALKGPITTPVGTGF